MNVREGFRWNVPVITYAYDKSFVDYFGPDGIAAVDQAIRHFNDLPAAAKISSDLSEYSPQTLRENFEAATLGLLDLKSIAMTTLMTQLGFADPIRWTFALRARTTEHLALAHTVVPDTFVPGRQLDRISHVPQIDEARAFHDTPAGDVETRDNAPRQHHAFSRSTAAPFVLNTASEGVNAWASDSPSDLNAASITW